MEKHLFIVTLMIVLVLNACNKNDKPSTSRENTTSNTDAKNDSSGMQKAMDNMMRNLHAQKTTGNPDLDFSMLMTAHLQGAIEISNAYFSNAKDLQIKSLAEQIINKNKAEIIELKNWSSFYRDTIETIGDDEYNRRMDENMTEMMKHSELVRTSDTDMDYAVVMVPHHRDAIEIAKVEIDFGKTEKLKNMAKDMIKDLQERIRVMEEWRTRKEQ